MANPIDDILRREGSEETNDPVDGGGRTKYGISERANPEAWADGVVTEAEARSIYERKYVKAPGFDQIPDESLRNILIDFGVTSGPGLAIQKLQALLGVGVDGVLGPKTLAAIEAWKGPKLVNLMVMERVKMACRIVKKDPSQLKWLNGWVNRFAEFME